MKLGCHVSIRGGYIGAAKSAYAAGARSFQFFPKNPRSLSVKSFDLGDARRCSDWCRENGLLSIAHTAYPVNLAATEPTMRELIKQSVLNDLQITDACGAIGLVVHFGKYKGSDLLHGYKLVIEMINTLLHEFHGNTLLLIENQAGEGTDIGMTLEELAQIRNLSAAPERIGFCIDTCHLFASGVWRPGGWQELWQRGSQLGLWPHVKSVHLNDSKYGTGSQKDRHAILGTGAIGKDNLLEMLNSPWPEQLPFILETPYSAEHSYTWQMKELRSNWLANEEG